jgi:mycothiol maleylpyruvate isomerase-like protein
MNPAAPTPLDVRPLFVPDGMALLDFLDSLSAPDWTTATACRGWDVRDVALHILPATSPTSTSGATASGSFSRTGIEYENWLVTGIRTLNLTVNRSLPPVRKWLPEFAECCQEAPFATVCHRRCCTGATSKSVESPTIGKTLVEVRPGGTAEDQITIFDGTGIWLQGLAAANWVYVVARFNIGPAVPWGGAGPSGAAACACDRPTLK